CRCLLPHHSPPVADGSGMGTRGAWRERTKVSLGGRSAKGFPGVVRPDDAILLRYSKAGRKLSQWRRSLWNLRPSRQCCRVGAGLVRRRILPGRAGAESARTGARAIQNDAWRILVGYAGVPTLRQPDDEAAPGDPQWVHRVSLRAECEIVV